MEFEDQCGQTTADVVIVGSGCSGCYLASILSRYYSVILLEFGQEQIGNPLIDDPLNAYELPHQETNFLFFPGGHSKNPPGKDLHMPLVTGGVLGGGSAVNGMQYVKGPREFFQRMEEATLDPDYGPCNAVRVYKCLEKYNYTIPPQDPNQRGEHGPLDVRQGVVNLPVARRFAEAANQVLGVPIVSDYNDMSSGICADPYWQVTQTQQKKREYGYNAFLKPITRKHNCLKCGKCLVGKNLRVYTNVLVSNVIFNDNKEAVGVETFFRGKGTTFTANIQVVLSAGFQSPLILQRSGVGPAAVLAEAGITPVHVNENVGRNILNHPILTVTGVGNVPPILGGDQQALYSGVVFSGDGTSSHPNIRGFEMIGIASPGAFTIASLILNAKSKGTASIYGPNPAHLPNLDFKYFSDGPDISSAIELVRQMVKILEKMGLTALNPPLTPDQIIDSHSQAYHWTGGCRISPCPNGGVVDSNCRVYGVKKLMVVDASVIPVNPLGNAQAPAYWIAGVVAEKIYRGVYAEWRRACGPSVFSPCYNPVYVGNSSREPLLLEDKTRAGSDDLTDARPCSGCNRA